TALTAHTTRIRRRFALGPTDRVLQFAALAFDASIDQIFPALTCGAALVLPEPGLLTPARLLDGLDRHEVTVANLPPAYFRSVIGELADGGAGVPGSLRLMVLGGDVVRPEEAITWTERFPDVELLNAYGPTEATVTSTVHEITAESARRPGGIPIGRPLGDRHLHLLDHHLRPAPLGTTAELHIGGTQLARGYLNRPALTADHFRPDPHTDQPGARLYRTGDLTRWTTDGHLTYHGRTDHQIKIRGYRIETGEIETRLRQHPHIHDTTVTTHHDQLVAYLVTTPGGTTEGIRDWLAERLPDYLVPTLFVPLDEIPRTVGGKTDRSRLPDPDGHRPEPAGAHEPPRDATERAVAEVWQEVLQLDRIGVHDNFFDLGGHSLLATLAVARLTKALERPVDVRLFFERPTIAEFAAALPPAPSRPEPMIGRMVRTGDFPLSFAQEGLWFLHRLAPEAPDYMAALAWRVDGALDRARLDRALERLAARHESLRTTFPLVDAQPVQRVRAAAGLAAAWHDLRGLDDPYGEAVRQAGAELHRPFDLAAGPLVRVTAWQVGAEDHLLVLALHHIVSDGWSLGVLVRELGVLYDGGSLPDLPVQYADFADWQRRELAGEGLEQGLTYWRERLAALPALELPTDRPRPAEPSWTGATREFTLEPEL
ncbi:condensation domain-containing protein, partial [Kitasatospora sp. NPDC056327]|uniref:condensation domain-containing protein n=1 Tax=Kitasatospora sp. NPDC056327 TaxID=3345785 RepID=UPI0035D757A7